MRHSLVINSTGKVVRKVFGQRVAIPSFEVYSSPTIRITDVKQRRFDLIDREARAKIMAQEDTAMFEALDNLKDQ